MRGLLRAFEQVQWALAAIGGGLCLFAILILTVVTVYGRYVLGADLVPGGYNMIEAALFPLMVFWGLPLAHREGAFPRLEVLASLAPGPVGKAISAFVLFVEAAVYAVVLWYAGKFTIVAIESGRQLQIGTGYWPAWPVVMMAPVSFGLMLIEIVRLILRDLRSVLAGN